MGGRFDRPAQRLALGVAARRRPDVPLAHVRPGRRDLRGADSRARRGRRRPAPDRDDLRHAEREGRRRRCARRRPRRPALDLVHRDRQERPQPLRPDRRGVLGVDRARRAADRRRQLLARRDRDAPVRRGPRAARTDLRLLPSERRPPERDGPPRRAAGRHEPLPARLRGRGAAERRRRLLRHDAGSRQGDRRRDGRPPRARGSAAASASVVQRDGAVRDRPGHRLRPDRRADERHRQRALPPHGRGGRLAGRPRGRARAGARRREPPRREHGRRPARRRSGDDDVPQPDRHRARGRADPDHGRQLALGGPRSGDEVHPGQGRRQLDLAQGRRGGVPRAGRAGPPLRRRGDRDGVRRAGAGRHRRAQGRDLRPRLRPADAAGGLPARGHRLRPERARGRDRDRGARRVREELHRGAAA